MTSQSFQGDSIGPQLTLDDFRIPPHVGEHLATMYGREDRIADGGEWVAAIRGAVEAAGEEPPTADDLCYVDDGQHEVEIGGETDAFVCVLDPLAVPFIEERPATVRSVTPEDERDVTIEITADAATATPDDAVVSLGVSRDVAAEGPVTHEDIYQESCPYICVFADADEYERWADGVDAATTSVPVDVGVAIARELVENLFEVAT